MNTPTFRFVDIDQNPLPVDEDLGVQYTRQYGGRWFVKVKENWNGRICLLGTDTSRNLDLFQDDEGLWSLPLKQQIRDVLPDQTTQSRYEAAIGGAGEVTVCLIGIDGRPLLSSAKKLIVRPGNLTESQFSHMIKEIGLMALSSISCTAYETQGSVGNDSHTNEISIKWKTTGGLSNAVDEVMRVMDMVIQQWPIVNRQPLKSIRSEVDTVSVDKAILSPQLLIQRRLNPMRQTFTTRCRVESVDCTENRFIDYVIYVLEKMAQGITELINSQQVVSIEFPIHASESLPPQVKTAIDDANSKGKGFHKNLLAKASQLQDRAATLKQIQNALRKQGVTRTTVQPVSTMRLMRSPGYGSIFQAYQHMKQQYEHLSHVVALYDACISGQIRPTWKIYELWCFLRLYHSVQSEVAGMKPQRNSQTPFEALAIQNGELLLAENKPFFLETTFDNGRHLAVDLQYQAYELSNTNSERKPDIVMRVTIDQTFKRKFIFDAKYRNYRGQGVKQFVQDIYGTARLKYLEGLAEYPKAAFVFHTTYSKEFDYWGEVPLYRVVSDSYNDSTANKSFTVKLDGNGEKGIQLKSCDFAAHRYGAVSLIPEIAGSEGPSQPQLRKLLHLLLQYHCSDTSYHTLKAVPGKFKLENLCLYCGCSAKQVPGYTGFGVCYQCPKCKFLWVLQYCGKLKHSILKTMNYHLHRKQNPDMQDWLYECPTCGARYNSTNPCEYDDTPPLNHDADIDLWGWPDGFVPEEPEYLKDAPLYLAVHSATAVRGKRNHQALVEEDIPF
jgi:hypothetical protein